MVMEANNEVSRLNCFIIGQKTEKKIICAEKSNVESWWQKHLTFASRKMILRSEMQEDKIGSLLV